MVDMAAAAGRDLHLADGNAQTARDAQFKALHNQGGPNPDKWADAKVQEMVYGHDCVQETLDHWDRYFAAAKLISTSETASISSLNNTNPSTASVLSSGTQDSTGTSTSLLRGWYDFVRRTVGSVWVAG